MTDEAYSDRQSFIEGKVLLFDKPYKWTSFDVVGRIRSQLRRCLGIKKIKVGHAGTLDPLATGLLIICTGKQTKSIDRYQGLDKTYTGTFFLGMTSASYDLETSPENPRDTDHINRVLLEGIAGKLTGIQLQTPPLFSAKKIGGERAYMHARKGLNTILSPNRIEIKEFDITGIRLPEVDFRVVCSRGTYIRSLARDFGELAGCGAYLSALRRTHIGSYSVEAAISPEDFGGILKSPPSA